MELWPGTMIALPNGQTAAWTHDPEPQLSLDLDDGDDAVAGYFLVPPGSVGLKVSDILLIRKATTGVPPTYKITFETPDASGGVPSGIAYGGSSSFEIAIDTANAKWYAVPSGNRPTLGAIGEGFFVRVGPGATAPTGANFITLAHGWSTSAEQLARPYHAWFETSWSKGTDVPAMALKLTNGTILWPGGYTTLSLSAFVGPAMKGVHFQSPFQSLVSDGAMITIAPAQDFSVRLYQAGVGAPLRTSNLIDKDLTVNAGNFQQVPAFWNPITLSKLVDYYLMAVGETAMSIRIARLDVLDAASKNAMFSGGLYPWELAEAPDAANPVFTSTPLAMPGGFALSLRSRVV